MSDRAAETTAQKKKLRIVLGDRRQRVAAAATVGIFTEQYSSLVYGPVTIYQSMSTSLTSQYRQIYV